MISNGISRLRCIMAKFHYMDFIEIILRNFHEIKVGDLSPTCLEKVSGEVTNISGSPV